MILFKENKPFIYNFDMNDDIFYFKNFPDKIQSSAEANVVGVIYESFVVPGDQDYLMSRLLAKNGLPRGFYWAAAQAIEKYLKAFLLLNGQQVKTYSHTIKKLLDDSCKIDKSISEINIHPHPNLQFTGNISDYIKKFNVEDFIEDLQKHGHTDNRYNAKGVEYNTGHIFAMDSLSSQLRDKIGVVSIKDSFKALSADLIYVFEEKNPWFQTHENASNIQIPSEQYPIQYSNSITKLEILDEHISNPAYLLALKWLNNKMQLPKKISEKLKNL